MAVEAITVGTVVLLASTPTTGHQLIVAAIVAGAGLMATEVTHRVEHQRRTFNAANSPHINMTSVWTLPAAMLTTPLLAAGVTIALYAYMWFRIWRTTGTRPHRVVVNTSNVIVTCEVTFWLAHHPLSIWWATGGPLQLVAGAVLVTSYWACNLAIVCVMLVLVRSDHSWRKAFGDWLDNSVELATLCLGMMATLLLEWSPWLLALLVLPLYVLHRAVLMQQLEQAATRDGKTGVFNLTGWRSRAETALARAERTNGVLGILMIDIDHFKRLNDTYGHPAGDVVLKATATAIRSAVRDRNDIVGRYGGEEFIVLLPDITPTDLAAVAERIRLTITELAVDIPAGDDHQVISGITVSVGTAATPTGATTLDDTIVAADKALYCAKRSGRNRVVAAEPGIEQSRVEQPDVEQPSVEEGRGEQGRPHEGAPAAVTDVTAAEQPRSEDRHSSPAN